ncbi:MAG: hypothetical protein NZ992_05345 [Candidatus Korarchaeum sp.]|nr:hypothetical protein [Candidatus Korarchaeum sp.]MDW8035344.1 hypothetical protein [Candidatus Korarchaeum sp.]
MSSKDPCSEARLLADAHPEMSAIQYLVRAACRGSLGRLKEFFDSSKELLARTCAEHLADSGVERVATISRSSAVINCIKRCSISEVIVSESLPGGEGLETASILKELGFSVILVRDSLLPWIAMRRGAIGLVGADRVTRTHLLNKAGTFALASAINTIAVPGLLKLQSGPYSLSEVVEDREGLSYLEAIFDETPLERFSFIIFEGLVLRHDEIEKAFDALDELLGPAV